MNESVTPRIRTVDVVKHYEHGLIKAVNGVSLSIAAGEIVALIGPSGCGKSTLLNLIGALDETTSGQIWIDGLKMEAYRPLHVYRTRMVGFVFQFHHLIASLDLIENVETALVAAGLGKNERRQRGIELLQRMGLKDRMHHRPTAVSGGERQRAAIARAIANLPAILLCDEPTGSVDTETGDLILDYLFQICSERNMTVVLATHNRQLAQRADRVIVMKDGRIADQVYAP